MTLWGPTPTEWGRLVTTQITHPTHRSLKGACPILLRQIPHQPLNGHCPDLPRFFGPQLRGGDLDLLSIRLCSRQLLPYLAACALARYFSADITGQPEVVGCASRVVGVVVGCPPTPPGGDRKERCWRRRNECGSFQASFRGEVSPRKLAPPRALLGEATRPPCHTRGKRRRGQFLPPVSCYGMDLGADDYLTKPCTVDELLAALATRLER